MRIRQPDRRNAGRGSRAELSSAAGCLVVLVAMALTAMFIALPFLLHGR